MSNTYIGLNVFRFMCFYLVFLMHCNWLSGYTTIDSYLLFSYPRFSLAVSYFFILSAFLLTKLALVEMKQQRFNFKQFFIRRALRIYPLYYFFILFVFFVLPLCLQLFNLPSFKQMPSILPFLTFTNNIFQQPSPFMLDFLWSIAVEEQFYLLFGLSVLLLQKKIIYLPIILILIFLGGKYFFPNTNITTLVNQLPYFAFGILAALIFHKYEHKLIQFFNQFWGKLTCFLLIAITLLITFFCYPLYQSDVYNNLLEPFVISSLVSVCLIVTSSIKYKMNTWNSIFDYLGKRTYGLYIWHGFVLTIAYTIALPLISKLHKFNLYHYILLMIVIVISMVSYSLIELPFLKLKKHFKAKL
jgi:peptidoglycan/LPS O-acetylase OafA/YrhL